MGTDIHGYWELKTSEGVWVAFRLVNEGRNYPWFGILANVRGHHLLKEQREWTARGMPPDPSDAWHTYTFSGTKHKSWLHNHTWLTYDEVLQANNLLREIDRRDWIAERSSYLTVYEPVPAADDEVAQLYLGSREGKPTHLPWFGQLSDLVPPHEFSKRLRMVVAFDS